MLFASVWVDVCADSIYVHTCERAHKLLTLSFMLPIKSLLTQRMSEAWIYSLLRRSVTAESHSHVSVIRSRPWSLSLSPWQTHTHTHAPLTHYQQAERNDHHKAVCLKDAQITSLREAPVFNLLMSINLSMSQRGYIKHQSYQATYHLSKLMWACANAQTVYLDLKIWSPGLLRVHPCI